jgi:pyruvate-formate lyase-activating enzyme
MKPFCCVVSDRAGKIFEIPGLSMAAGAIGSWCRPDDRSCVPLPESSLLFTLPGRLPVGYDSAKKKFVVVRDYCGVPVFAVAAFMPPGFLQTFPSAYREVPGAPRLPLFSYTAAGWRNGRFFAAGYRIDRRKVHEIADESLADIDVRARAMKRRFPANRLVAHLVDNCVMRYRCPNACNCVLGRWECPIPVSRACNAACVGCISRQSGSSGIPSTQHRIDFVPSVNEIIEYVVPHLKVAADPVASFGQGCEGEPLLQADLIEESIRGIRARTGRGIINLNTNGSCPRDVERLCRAGLNSMRVSLNSAQPEFYNAYYRPKNYSFEDVLESIMIAKRHNVWVSLNYLVFPGFTDHPLETRALKKLLCVTRLDMIQTRNLNIDQAWYINTLGLRRKLAGNPAGMVAWVGRIRKMFPRVKLGYFNPTRRTMLA